MKQFFTFFTGIFMYSCVVVAQTPACSTLSNSCTGSNVASDFRNPIVFSGTDLTLGVKYKFSNVITLPIGSTPATLDAIVEVTAISNAVMEDVDDDNATSNASGATVNVPDWFSPRIKANVNNFACTDLRGYVEFTVTFYPHFTGTTLPTAYSVAGLNFIHYDMDGHTVGSNGWFKEIGYEKVISANNPQLVVNNPTELTNGGAQAGNYNLYLGSTTERDGVSQCAEVAIIAKYSNAQSSLSFRMGYDYKAPTTGCSGNQEAATYRQYGGKFGCVSFPTGGPLPVSLINLSASYNSGICTISWATAQETDLVKYEIQRSTDGIHFEKTGTVAASNQQSVQNYRYEDNVSGINAKYIYYRLGIYDNRLGYKISNIVSVKTADWNKNEMTLSPNPAFGNAQAHINASRQAIADIYISNAEGKLMQSQKAAIQKGNNSIMLNNIALLPNGLYIVKLVAGENIFSSKLIVWK
jgi:hypothetical protein